MLKGQMVVEHVVLPNQQTVIWSRLFYDRSAEAEANAIVDGKLGEPMPFSLPIPNAVTDRLQFHIWLYLRRALCGFTALVHETDACAVSDSKESKFEQSTTKQYVFVRFGILSLSLRDVVAAASQRGVLGMPVHDIGNEVVGRVRLVFGDDVNPASSTALSDARSVSRLLRYTPWVTESADALAAMCRHKGMDLSSGGNISEVRPRPIWSTVSLPCGFVPIWSVSLMAIRDSLEAYSVDEFSIFLDNVLQHAGRHFLDWPEAQLKNVESWTPAMTGALIHDMCTMKARACLYVRDLTLRADSKLHNIDEWTQVDDHAHLDMAAIDCEDGAMDTMCTLGHLDRLGRSVAAAGAPPPPASRALVHVAKQQAQRYCACMAILTVFDTEMERYLWHNIVINLDREWVLDSRTSVSKTERVPAILLDTSTYVAGCWDYKDAVYESSEVFEKSSRMVPVPSMPKMPSSFARAVKLYGHVQTLVTPSLERDTGQVQWVCTYKGQLGIPIERLMEYHADCRLYPLRYDPGQHDAALQALYRPMPRLLKHRLRPDHVPQVLSPAQRTTESKLVFDSIYRGIDWTPEVEKQVRAVIAQTRGPRAKSIEIVRLPIVEDLDLVSVRAWT